MQQRRQQPFDRQQAAELLLSGPLAELQVADSHFFGFCRTTTKTVSSSSKQVAQQLQTELYRQYPDASHISIGWVTKQQSSSSSAKREDAGWEEDGEPTDAVGPGILAELHQALRTAKLSDNGDEAVFVVTIAIVRFFGTQLLGVTCGRLSQCYRSIAKLTLHRHLRGPDVPLNQDVLGGKAAPQSNLYGLAAGDTELIVNVAVAHMSTSTSNMLMAEEAEDTYKEQVLKTLRKELQFEAMVDSKGEELPRLQNLQATISDPKVIPIYRYPGNYTGTEWPTHHWSATCLQIKQMVEQALQPLIHQSMNHCVSNYYRHGSDFIDHHSDKTLDLEQSGVIVSVSLGEERVMEFKRRQAPHDETRIVLPHGSMLVLGPYTNQQFTHSVLPSPTEHARLSLTFRTVNTFLDQQTGRLFGQGALSSADTLQEARLMDWMEQALLMAACGAISAMVFMDLRLSPQQQQQPTPDRNTKPLSLALVAASSAMGCYSLRRSIHAWRQRREELAAREFFSQTSTRGTHYL